jgi:hypothetical protein
MHKVRSEDLFMMDLVGVWGMELLDGFEWAVL